MCLFDIAAVVVTREYLLAFCQMIKTSRVIAGLRDYV